MRRILPLLFLAAVASGATVLIDSYRFASTELDGLIARWYLDEASGATAIDSIGDYDLTDGNSDVGTDTTNKVQGTAARTRTSASTSSVLTRGTDDAAFECNAGSFTVTCWVRFTDLSTTRFVLGKWQSWDQESWQLSYYAALSQLNVVVKEAQWSEAIRVSAGSISTDTWYFVAMGWNSSTTKAWIRLDTGTRQESASISTPWDSSAPFTIFREGSSTNAYPLVGQVDAVRFFNRNLSDSELNTVRALDAP